MENKQMESYSPLFALGLLSAALGAILWLAFQVRVISYFPRQAHGNIMFFGFLWAYVAGFLMTAVPKMTKTNGANVIELFLALFLVILQWALNIRNAVNWSTDLYLVQIIFLVVFVGRRFLVRRQIPFEGFVFMPFAFICAFAGFISIKWGTPYLDMATFYLLAGQGFILNLICGLGTRLIPVLTRVPAAVNPDVEGQKSKILKYFILALVLNVSFLLEFLRETPAAYILRTLFVIYIAVFYFKIFKNPTVRSYVGWGIRAAVVFLIAGYAGLVFKPELYLPLMHLVYIGGFTLVTLMVSTRVTLAHGPQDLTPELNSKALIVTLLAFLISSIARFYSGTNLGGTLLAISVYCFLIALVSWATRFYKELLLIKNS